MHPWVSKFSLKDLWLLNDFFPKILEQLDRRRPDIIDPIFAKNTPRYVMTLTVSYPRRVYSWFMMMEVEKLVTDLEVMDLDGLLAMLMLQSRARKKGFACRYVEKKLATIVEKTMGWLLRGEGKFPKKTVYYYLRPEEPVSIIKFLLKHKLMSVRVLTYLWDQLKNSDTWKMGYKPLLRYIRENATRIMLLFNSINEFQLIAKRYSDISYVILMGYMPVVGPYSTYMPLKELGGIKWHENFILSHREFMQMISEGGFARMEVHFLYHLDIHLKGTVIYRNQLSLWLFRDIFSSADFHGMAKHLVAIGMDAMRFLEPYRRSLFKIIKRTGTGQFFGEISKYCEDNKLELDHICYFLHYLMCYCMDVLQIKNGYDHKIPRTEDGWKKFLAKAANRANESYDKCVSENDEQERIFDLRHKGEENKPLHQILEECERQGHEAGKATRIRLNLFDVGGTGETVKDGKFNYDSEAPYKWMFEM